MLQAEKCQVCIKTQKHTTVYARKVYNVQLHPELFDWHVVGPNIWKIETLKSNLNYMMHNETFHVTLRKVSGYRLLFKTLTDLTPFTPLKELLQDPAHAKQIRRVIASLTQIQSAAGDAEKDAAVPVAILPYLQMPQTSTKKNDAFFFDGLFINAQLLHFDSTITNICVRVRSMCLQNEATNQLLSVFALWVKLPNNSLEMHLYKFDEQSGDIVHAVGGKPITLAFSLNDNNSWKKVLRRPVKDGFKPGDLLYNFNSATHEIRVQGCSTSLKDANLYKAIAAIQAHKSKFKFEKQKNDNNESHIECLTNNPSDFVLIENSNPFEVFLVYLRGRHPRSLRILPFDVNAVGRELCIEIRDPSLLPMANTVHTMSTNERISFISELVKSVLDRTHATRFLQESDTETCVWLQFFATSIPMQLLAKMTNVRIKLLHIEAAWHRFQGQLLDMTHRNLSSQPVIMFHGIRSDDVDATMKDIESIGFNAKHARESVYGGGGVYCSPDAGCAMQYVKYAVGASKMQNHMYVCLALPGKIGFNGTRDQKMQPDQNSWCAYVAPYTVFCIEGNALLPIARITFS